MDNPKTEQSQEAGVRQVNLGEIFARFYYAWMNDAEKSIAPDNQAIDDEYETLMKIGVHAAESTETVKALHELVETVQKRQSTLAQLTHLLGPNVDVITDVWKNTRVAADSQIIQALMGILAPLSHPSAKETPPPVETVSATPDIWEVATGTTDKETHADYRKVFNNLVGKLAETPDSPWFQYQTGNGTRRRVNPAALYLLPQLTVNQVFSLYKDSRSVPMLTKLSQLTVNVANYQAAADVVPITTKQSAIADSLDTIVEMYNHAMQVIDNDNFLGLLKEHLPAPFDYLESTEPTTK